ncbi:hypothetical protein [Aliidiomarina soli]|nr:hypothetical protein [Aliidiomarina soli]
MIEITFPTTIKQIAIGGTGYIGAAIPSPRGGERIIYALLAIS